MSELLTVDDFKDKVGHTYVISFDLDDDDVDDQVNLELIECTPYEKYKHAESQRMPFILIFRGPQGSTLPDQMYAVKNSETGEVIDDLFLSGIPAGEGEHGQLYEACFN